MLVDPLLAAYINGASMTLGLLMAGRFLSVAPRSPSAWLLLILVINGICTSLLARQDYAWVIPEAMQLQFGDWYWVLNIARNSSSAVFLLLIHRIFVEHRSFPWWVIALFCIQVFVEEPLGWLLGPEWTANQSPLQIMVNEITPALIQAAFGVIAVVWMIRDWSSDLLAKRRATRAVVLLMAGGAASLFIERFGYYLGVIDDIWMYPIHIAISVLNAILLAVILFGLMRQDVIGYIDPSLDPADQEPPAEPATADPDVARILSALQDEQIYRQAGLTVNSLARHLNLPEYRLRALIHQHLGYKNFNTLLHHYRIEEVCGALADPDQNNTPILTLALSAGYQSIAPFNRAFRQTKGVTPSNYRIQAQQNP